MSSKIRNRLAQCVLDFEPRTWGGKREGAGRKKLKGKHDSAHRERPELRRYHPVHVVMRVRTGVPKLRQGRAYRAVRRSLVKCLGNEAFRVCHVSIQGTHLHFLVEASSTRALSAGMQRLNILTAKALNRELGRRGKLFAFRYHATQITSPRQARSSLAYVLNNWRRHREDETCERAQLAKVDPYSSALSFDGWKGVRFDVPADFIPLPVSEPSTWLLRVGWRRHGLIDVREVPGPMTTR
jgi:REP element-mobilizing transposase RayT